MSDWEEDDTPTNGEGQWAASLSASARGERGGGGSSSFGDRGGAFGGRGGRGRGRGGHGDRSFGGGGGGGGGGSFRGLGGRGGDLGGGGYGGRGGGFGGDGYDSGRFRGRGRGGGGGGFRNNYENDDNIWGGGAGAGIDSWGGESDGYGGGRGFGGGRGRGFGDRGGGYFDGGRRGGGGRGGGRGGGGWSRGDADQVDSRFGNDAPRKASNYVPEEEPEDQLFQHGISSGINFARYSDVKCHVTGENPPAPVVSFEESGLRQLLMDNVKKSGYSTPTPVQKYAIPIIMEDRDLMACAQTGSGKTAAFLLPIIHKLLEEGVTHDVGSREQCPEVVVIAPTRELARQIREEARKFALRSSVKSIVVYGGTSVMYQRELVQKGVNVLIGTPGRLNHFIEEGTINLKKVKFLVLDEADRMLDMGFLPEINRVVRDPNMPSKEDRRTLMFSATFPEAVQNIAAEFLHNYLFLAVGIVGGACTDVRQTVFKVSRGQKRDQLIEILKDCPKGEKTLVFLEMRKHVDFLATFLCQSEFPATSMHGDRLQPEREEALADFRSGQHNVLVATAVAARGLDIRNVAHVINYDLPNTIDEYVHRIGRTGRIGNSGKATSFYDDEKDGSLARDLLKVLSDSQQEVPPWLREEAGRNLANPAGGGGLLGSGYGGRDIRQHGAGRGGRSGGKNSVEEPVFHQDGALEEDESWD